MDALCAHQMCQLPALLGGTTVSYYTGLAESDSRPTVLMLNSLFMSASIFENQFNSPVWNPSVNMMAVEPLGHGETRSESPVFTELDNARMCIELLKAIDVKKVFVMGYSGGGWIGTAIAALKPDLVEGLIPINSCMDAETDRIRGLGCWDVDKVLTPFIKDNFAPDVFFEMPKTFCELRLSLGFDVDNSSTSRAQHITKMQADYAGENGRQRAVQAATSWRDRTSLHGQLSKITCPVLWIQGAGQSTYSVENARVEIQMFTGSKKAELQVVPGSQHLLAEKHSQKIDELVLGFVGRWHGK